RLKSLLNLPRALSEPELIEKFKSYAERNASGFVSFLGAGVNDHYIPTVIDSLVSRGEFLTSYTPYQAEITQGTLQATFEFQTLMCQLTGMEVSNASMYDGSTALTEAILMAARVSQRSRFLVASSVHPEYRTVMNTYARHQDLALTEIEPGADGAASLASLKQNLGTDVAAIVVQSPNFFGNLEPLAQLAELAHRQGALLVVAIAEALSLGIIAPPGPAGADIVCGEAQSLGVPSSFGGPHVGFLTCREKFLRNLPGRLIGQTVDSEGSRGFVLTLSTREQHIRREKATSNICTNQTLFALMATIYCSLLGKKGIREVAIHNVAKTQYALSEMKRATSVEILYPGPRFNELVVQLPVLYENVAAKFTSAKIIPGLPLAKHYPALKNCLLLSFTETKSKTDIDRLIQLLGTIQ
ncbi:MAG: aminomethyl-transferring glycine dehydrogenase subunit GcvPA, partial [Acidobacteria bacterium]|nr:aminomethyl-transferring glycine dehydrogenase subunit GcvPA [Acidobacteriota bacterium]